MEDVRVELDPGEISRLSVGSPAEISPAVVPEELHEAVVFTVQ